MRAPDRLFEGYVFDLDGTVYLGEELLPGAEETLAVLKRLSSSAAAMCGEGFPTIASARAPVEASTAASMAAQSGRPPSGLGQ